MAYTTINKSTDYFNTKLYTGNGSDGHSITGVGFQPDLIWLKSRSLSEHHIWSDAIRGANKQIYSNLTYAEATSTTRIASFASDGFTLGAGDLTNKNAATYTAWNWKANGTGSANTDGSTSSTVSANTTAGFSVVKYAGNSGGNGYSATIGHGLGVKPSCMIIKNLTASANWAVYHKDLNNGTNPEVKYLEFNTNGQLDDAGIFYDTAPTNSVFTVGTSDKTNEVNKNYIAYCFAEKKGYSKFGSYTGNGNNAHGPFVYTGFKPAFVMFKRTSGTGNWQLLDNKRLGYNPLNYTLYPNTSTSDQDEGDIYLLSNGFQLRGTGTDGNGSGSTYIYMAFASAPLVGSNNIPATAW